MLSIISNVFYSMYDNIEFSLVVSFIVIVLCLCISLWISWRQPLYYHLFLVEMHTWTTRRMVQVIHLGQEFIPTIPWDRFVNRMRARAPRIAGEERIAISEPHVVIQSPNTVIDSPVGTTPPDSGRITLWDIEMPPRIAEQPPNALRDSQYAAAAAIAVLARGNDISLRSRVFFDQINNIEPEIRPAGPRTEVPRGSESEADVPTPEPTITRSSSAPPPVASVPRASTNEPSTSRSAARFSIGPSQRFRPSSDQDEEIEDDGNNSSLNSDDETELMNESLENVDPDFHIESHPIQTEKALIRLKFMNDTEKETHAFLTDSVAKYKIENVTSESDKVIRLIFQGQLLRDDNKSLQSYGITSGSVLHCHISSTPFRRQDSEAVEQETPVRQRVVRTREGLADRHRPIQGINRPIIVEENEPFSWTSVFNFIFFAAIPVATTFGVDMVLLRNDRRSMRPSLIWIAYQWMYNFIMDENNGRFPPLHHPWPRQLFYIFACQLVAVSIFFFFFPHVVDSTALTLLILLVLYFIFVIWRNNPSENGDQNVAAN